MKVSFDKNNTDKPTIQCNYLIFVHRGSEKFCLNIKKIWHLHICCNIYHMLLIYYITIYFLKTFSFLKYIFIINVLPFSPSNHSLNPS